MPSLQATNDAIEEILNVASAMACLKKPLRKWQGIVLHHSWKPSVPTWGVNYGKVFNEFHYKTNGWNNGCGYDFVVSWNVDSPSQIRIWKTYRWENQLDGAHAINRKGELGIPHPNKTHLGICVVGDFDDKKMPEEAARKMDTLLIEPLLHSLGLKASPATVLQHNQFEYKTCPGSKFDMTIFHKEDGNPVISNRDQLVGHKLLTHLEDVYKG